MAVGGICFGAKHALEHMSIDRGHVFSPMILADQDRYKKVKQSGFKLWKLKYAKPQLFANMERIDQELKGIGCEIPAGGIPGFDRVSPGWVFDSKTQLYIEEASQRCLWLDAAAGMYRELAVGEDLSGELSLTGAATTSSSSKGPVVKTSASSLAASASSRHLIILDLHKAADVFSLDLTHIDRPAAMLAVYKLVEGAAPPEDAAKCLHQKILRRLAAFRGQWSEEALQAALVDAISTAGVELKAKKGIAGAVTLVLGSRLVTAASHGATCAIADALPENMKDIRMAVASQAGCADLQAACLRLDARSAACVLLHTEAIDEQVARKAAAHVERGRPKAGAVALLQQASVTEAARSRAAACAHLAWAGADEVDGSIGGPASKRARVGDSKFKEKDQQVRCLQVLVKYVGCNKAIDKVRRKPIRRSQAEAEVVVLSVLKALEEARAGGGAAAAEKAFTKQCRDVSECTSSLRGGDLAGDIGWLRLPEVKPGEKIPREVAQRMIVVRAALSLAVNEVSDIVVTDDGVHLLKRAA